MDEGEAKMDGERWLFSQIVVIGSFIKNLVSYHTLLIHFKETSLSVSTSLEVKVFKKSTVKHPECDNVGLEWKILIQRHLCPTRRVIPY